VSLFALGLVVLMAQDRRQILGEIEAFDTQILTLTQQAEALDSRQGTLAAERDANAALLTTAESALSARRDETRRRVHTFYRLKRRGLARLLFDAENPVDLRRRVRYLLAVIRADEAGARDYATQLAARHAAAAKLEADANALAGVEAELRTRLDALQAERERRRALIRDIQARPETAALVVQERAAAATALTRAMPTPDSVAPVGDAAAFRAEKGRLPRPVAGPVTRGFGAYVDPASGLDASNLGIDVSAALGSPFRAVADGVVTRSGYVRGYGQVVMVQHGPYTTLYAHANGLRVAQGQAVRQGDVLGLVGNTGLAEDAEARLHFELRYNNTPQDPAPWLAR
jgi:murein DD-endopeptidase MepM/ murein hydrolase activator NlpD